MCFENEALYVPISKRYLPIEIREIDFPGMDFIWTPWTCSKNSQGDNKGRARLIILDLYELMVLGTYHGGGTLTHYMVTPLERKTASQIEERIPWEKYGAIQ